MDKLTVKEAITNKKIFSKDEQNTFLNQLKKNNGRLQSKTKQRIPGEYLRFYSSAKWEGRGKDLRLVLGEELDVEQKKICVLTKDRTQMAALLIVLYTYLKSLRHGENLNLRMNRSKWMQETAIRVSANDSYNYKDRYSSLLYYVLAKNIGRENKDIIEYAINNYETARREYDRSLWNSITAFLIKHYGIEPQTVILYNYSEEALLNHYAKELLKYLNKKQKGLTSKNIFKKMEANWKAYNEALEIPEEKPANRIELILRNNNTKRNINKTFAFDDSKVGLERIIFDFTKLKASDYEKYEGVVNELQTSKQFNKNFKGIEATTDDRERIDFVLDLYVREIQFDKAELNYAPYSEKSQGYKHTEETALNELGYEKRYTLCSIDYKGLQKYLENPIYILDGTTRKLTLGEDAINVLIGHVSGLVQPLVESEWEDKIRKKAHRNKAFAGLGKQDNMHPIVNDTLYIVMRMTDNFYNNDDLPNSKEILRMNKEKKIKRAERINVIDDSIREVIKRYIGEKGKVCEELSEEEQNLQKDLIDRCYSIMEGLANHI